VSEVALSFSLTEADAPTYQLIAHEAERLRALGLSLNRIAEHLGVDGKTVVKSLRWTATGPQGPLS
jgi:DNA-binding CsgD family transcriptional regulator